TNAGSPGSPARTVSPAASAALVSRISPQAASRSLRAMSRSTLIAASGWPRQQPWPVESQSHSFGISLEDLRAARGMRSRGRAAAVTGDLAAEPRGGEDLARVAQRVGVEGAADELHGVQGLRAEHLRHVARFIHPDAVLAGDRPAVLDARVEDGAGDHFS